MHAQYFLRWYCWESQEEVKMCPNLGQISSLTPVLPTETKGTNATTIADTPTILSCGTEGSKSAPVDIYWTDKAGTKYKTKSCK